MMTSDDVNDPLNDPLNPANPNPPKFRVDPDHQQRGAVTNIFIRARTDAGKWVSCDIGELDRDSLHRWLRSRGGQNLWAENCVLMLLGHEQLLEEPSTRRYCSTCNGTTDHHRSSWDAAQADRTDHHYRCSVCGNGHWTDTP